MMNTNPNEIVERLQKEHLYLNEFCRRLKAGIVNSKSEAKICRYIDYFWENHFKPHILAEEEIFLLINTSRALEKVLEEHQLIEKNMMNVLTDKSVKLECLSVYTDHIMNHIVFEEKEIYPLIARSLTNWQVRIIEWQLLGFQIGMKQDNYQDKFWLSD